MSDEDESAFSIRNLITIVPVVGVILAAMYDLGSFGSMDKSMFTLFTWSDHIVFALQAVFNAIVILSVLGWSLSKYTFNTPLNQQPPIRLWFLVILFSSFAVASAVFFKAYDQMVFWIFMSVVALSAIYLKITLAGLLLTYSVSLAALAYTVGYNDSQSALHLPSEQLLFTTNGQMHGRMFRSGERGMLFFDTSTRRMNFLRWDEIKRLEAIVNIASSPLR
jgi:hypothetical protein